MKSWISPLSLDWDMTKLEPETHNLWGQFRNAFQYSQTWLMGKIIKSTSAGNPYNWWLKQGFPTDFAINQSNEIQNVPVDRIVNEDLCDGMHSPRLGNDKCNDDHTKIHSTSKLWNHELTWTKHRNEAWQLLFLDAVLWSFFTPDLCVHKTTSPNAVPSKKETIHWQRNCKHGTIYFPGMDDGWWGISEKLMMLNNYHMTYFMGIDDGWWYVNQKVDEGLNA